MNPANKIIVVRFFPDPREIRRERAALHLIALADGVASQAAAGFEQFLAMRGVSGLVFRKRIG